MNLLKNVGCTVTQCAHHASMMSFSVLLWGILQDVGCRFTKSRLFAFEDRGCNAFVRGGRATFVEGPVAIYINEGISIYAGEVKCRGILTGTVDSFLEGGDALLTGSTVGTARTNHSVQLTRLLFHGRNQLHQMSFYQR